MTLPTQKGIFPYFYPGTVQKSWGESREGVKQEREGYFVYHQDPVFAVIPYEENLGFRANSAGWAIVHVPTGLWIADRFRRKAEALRAVEIMIPWIADPDGMRSKNRKKIVEAMGEDLLIYLDGLARNLTVRKGTRNLLLPQGTGWYDHEAPEGTQELDVESVWDIDWAMKNRLVPDRTHGAWFPKWRPGIDHDRQRWKTQGLTWEHMDDAIEKHKAHGKGGGSYHPLIVGKKGALFR
jgi:hypothetical protein